MGATLVWAVTLNIAGSLPRVAFKPTEAQIGLADVFNNKLFVMLNDPLMGPTPLSIVTDSAEMP